MELFYKPNEFGTLVAMSENQIFDMEQEVEVQMVDRMVDLCFVMKIIYCVF